MKPGLKSCPTCGSRKIRRVDGDYPTTIKGVKVTVPNVERDECPNCGEVLLDYDGMKKLEAYWKPKKKSARTA